LGGLPSGPTATGAEFGICRPCAIRLPRSAVAALSACALKLLGLAPGLVILVQRCTTTLRAVPGLRARLRLRALAWPIRSLGHRAPLSGLDVVVAVAERRRLVVVVGARGRVAGASLRRSEEHTSELQSRENLVC